QFLDTFDVAWLQPVSNTGDASEIRGWYTVDASSPIEQFTGCVIAQSLATQIVEGYADRPASGVFSLIRELVSASLGRCICHAPALLRAQCIVKHAKPPQSRHVPPRLSVLIPTL